MTNSNGTYDRKAFTRQEWKEYVADSGLSLDLNGNSSELRSGGDLQNKRSCSEPSIANSLLNYFVVMSYEESSIRMARELGYVRNNKDAELFNQVYKIRERAHVRELIKRGRILEAIELICSTFGAQVLENVKTESSTKPKAGEDDLHFKLLLLNLIEMIRKHHQSGASPEESSGFILELIEYSQQKLAFKADSNKRYMKELELVMTLLLFPMERSSEGESSSSLPKSLRNLYSLSLRTKIADLVNRKLLESMHAEILSSSNSAAFPDLIGFKTFHKGFSTYNGLLNTKTKDSTDIEYTTTKLGDIKGGLDATPASKPWDTDAWKNTASLLKERDSESETKPDDSVEASQQIQYEAKLNQVMKLWAWCENQLHNCGVGVPRVEGGV